jgi:hypothetical protein
MTATEILKAIKDNYWEHLEMMTPEERFIIISRELARALAFEMAEKEYYKECFEALCRGKLTHEKN